jgi:tyrosyl-tRNA synthetase
MVTADELLDDLRWRGLMNQVAAEERLTELLAAGGATVYCGFDPSGPSLHIGHLVPLLCLARFQRYGHRPIALAGGGTGLIGDPSGKSEERVLNSEETVAEYVRSIRAQLERLVDFEAGAIVENNVDWLRELTAIELMRDVGKHFPMGWMLGKESVRARMEGDGISYTEFSYMVLQAYDFLHLSREYGCLIQIGGSDQWGNIIVGVDLIRRLRRDTAYGLTWPLLMTSAGTKMGKTDKATSVWLDPNLTSPYQFFQYWVRTDDGDVPMRLRWFTFLPRERIEELDTATAEHPERREAQRALAFEVTAMVHGEDEARRAQRAADVLFTEAIAELDEQTLLDVFSDAPSVELARTDLGELSLVEAMVRGGVVKSNGDGRKLVTQGGAYVNNRRIEDTDHRLTTADLLRDRYVVLRKGKANYHLLRFT